jgi:membrane protein
MTTVNRLSLWLTLLGRFVVTVARRFARDRCSREAAALAFTTALAVVPLTAVGFAVLSVFPVYEKWMSAVQSLIYGNLVPAAGAAVSRYLQQFAANAGRLTMVGLVFLFLTAVALMATVEKAFNYIWHIRKQRKLGRRITAYWAVITLGPVLMGLSLTITSYIASLPLFAQEKALTGKGSVLLQMVPLMFEFATFILLYMVVPNCAVRLRHAAIGAVVATVLFEIAKLMFGMFVRSFSAYQTIYGAVAALPVFLIWIYLSWVVTLLGAEVTAALPRWLASLRNAKAPVKKPAAKPPKSESAKPPKSESESARRRTLSRAAASQ